MEKSEYRVTDPKLINQTMDRFDFLLNDQDSPVLSNFLHMVDYNDGSDLPSLETVSSIHGIHLEKKLEEQLKKMELQTSKMSELMGEVVTMTQSMQGMKESLSQMTSLIKEDLSSQHQ
jgi:hypothetical protein